MNSQYRFTAAVLSMCLIAGCGQKGPLYLPEDPGQIKSELPARESEADVETKAADPDSPADEDNGLTHD